MAKHVVRKPKKKANPLKVAKIENIDYKDTALLRKFISDRGKIRSRRMTGLSRRQQALAAREIKRAREMGLLPFVMPKLERARGGRPDRSRGEDRDEQTMATAEAAEARNATAIEETVIEEAVVEADAVEETVEA